MISHIIQQPHRCLLLWPWQSCIFCKNFVQQSRVIALRGMVDSTDAFTAPGPGLGWGALLKQVPQCNAQRSGHQLICLVFYIIQSWTTFLTRRLRYNLANCSDPAKGQLLPPDGSRRQQQATKFLMLPHISPKRNFWQEDVPMCSPWKDDKYALARRPRVQQVHAADGCLLICFRHFSLTPDCKEKSVWRIDFCKLLCGIAWHRVILYCIASLHGIVSEGIWYDDDILLIVHCTSLYWYCSCDPEWQEWHWCWNDRKSM